MNIDFKELKELELNNIGAWPLPIIMILMGCASVLILVMGYWFDTKPQLNQLNYSQQEELSLKNTFETKVHRAVNLAAYKAQMKIMKENFSVLLRQLPEKTEVPGLLEDISHQGLASGLEFKSIRLQPERAVDFYIELPIEISVVGNYHQLAQFVSNVAALPRIVTLHDFVIHENKVPEQGQNKDAKKSANQSTDNLIMNVTAKTYRYAMDADKKNEVK